MKGADIIFDEKEKSFSGYFLINLISDNIPKFNDYLKKKSIRGINSILLIKRIKNN